jgi:hypothetical protein
MKQFLLFLSLAGAALYALLVFTHNAITDGKSGRIPLYQTQPDHPVPQRLSSWKSHLRSSAPNSQPTAHLPPQQNVASTLEAKSAVSTAAQVEWTKVMLAARMHDQASVSSPTVRLFSPGIDLQVIRREGVWLQVTDPVSQERGWILEKYLSPSNGPSSIQASRELTGAVPIAAPQKSKVEPILSGRNRHGYLNVDLLSRDGTRIDGVGALISGVISGLSCLVPHSLGDEI